MTLFKILAIDSQDRHTILYTNQYDEQWKKIVRIKGAPPCTQACGNVQDRYQRNWGAMKNYLRKNQESDLKIEIIQFQIEDIVNPI
jgi:hypothetical protein